MRRRRVIVDPIEKAPSPAPNPEMALADAVAAFDMEPLTRDSLNLFGAAVAASDDLVVGEEFSASRTLAAAHYLDAVLRLPVDRDTLGQARELARIAASDLRLLSRCRSSLGVGTLNVCLLSLTVSTLLVGRQSSAIPADWREKIVSAAWWAIEMELPSSRRADCTHENLLALRVAADALDASLLADGRLILKKMRNLTAGDQLPVEWLRRKLRWARRTITMTDGGRSPLTVADLESAADGIDRETGERDRPRLPVLSAAEPGRHREGKGLLSLHRRASRWDYQRLTAVVIMLMIIFLPLVLVLQAIQGPNWRAWHKVPIGLTADDAVNVNVQLLAAAATLMIALAVGTRVTDTDRRVAVNRFWAIGRFILTCCGLIGIAIGCLSFASDSFENWPGPLLVLALGLMTGILAIAADGLRLDRHLQAAYALHQLAIVDNTIRRWREADPRTWDTTSSKVNKRRILIYSMSVPTLTFLVLCVILLDYYGYDWGKAAEWILLVALLLGYLVGPTTYLAIRLASSVHTVRYRTDLSFGQKVLRTGGWSGAYLGVTAFLLWIGILFWPDGWVYAGMVWVVGIAPGLVPVVGLLSARPDWWPRFPARRARIEYEASRRKLKEQLDRPQTS